MRTTPANRRAGRGFTLVEMLVVITIIGILAGLAVPAVIMALRRVKIGAIKMELSQLEMACQAYKEKYGEYPPDFAYVGPATAASATIQAAAQNAVLRHLAKAFPRYQPGISTGRPTNNWKGFVTDLNSAGVLATTIANRQPGLNPQTALCFWLGGIPDPVNHNLPSGFAADPTNPFKTPAQCPSRIASFFDFDSTRLKNVANFTQGPPGDSVWAYWPQGVIVNQDPNTAQSGAITYFRAENGAYTVTDPTGTVTVKSQSDFGDTSATPGQVYPAIDTRLTTATSFSYVNPKSVQIFTAGLDTKFGALPQFPVNGTNQTVLAFPTGENYQPYTYDDITNFSSGTLEDSVP
jgi:prepilin-type N-terminal cleavage/methylation domain-containing protein